MAILEKLFSIVNFLTIILQIPKNSKKAKSSKPGKEIKDTEDLVLETQRLSSIILRTLNPVSLQDKKSEIIEKVKQRYIKLNKKLHTSEFMKRRDKIVFLSSILNLVFASYLLGSHPCYFHYYYTLCCLVLIPTRFVNYRIQKYHYFLFDFCYFANTIQMVYLIFFPTSQILYNIVYAFACGPLIIAVPLFQNSYVPHSIDRMTSLVIHLFPAISMWAIKSSECEAFLPSIQPLGLFKFFLYSVTVYLLWIIPYYFIIFYFTYERWQRKQNITLYKYAMQDQTSLTYYYCGIFGEKYRPLMFMTQHALSSLALIFFAFIQIQYYWIFSAFLFVIAIWSVWNGANYYIEFFARRYEKDLHVIEEIYQNLG